MEIINIISEDPASDDATMLMNELSDCLKAITGASGKNSFNIEDMFNKRSLFVIARDSNGIAVGCGAFRSIDNTTAEIKRMYTKIKGCGIGEKIISYLEKEAYKMGYSKFILETRLINQQAVSFYNHNGFTQIPNYGKYVHNAEAVCFEKHIF